MINHEFTSKIIDKLTKDTGVDGKKLLNSSSLLEYINIKTKSANKGSNCCKNLRRRKLGIIKN